MARKRQEPEEKIGQRIRRLRLERGLSQRELSEPGVSYAYVSRIEAGQRTPSIKALRLLARKLGVSEEYLETGAKVPRAAERELRLSNAELELRLNRDLHAAEQVFRKEAAKGDEPALEARARAGLGLIAAQRSDHAATVRELEAATRSGYFPPETRPDLYRALGVAYASRGAPKEAIDLFSRCLARLRERAADDVTLQVRFGVWLASAYSELGDIDRARAALTDAGALAERPAAAPQVRINLYWAMAREAWYEADSEAALTSIRRAIGLLEATEDTYNLALAHLLAAQLLNLDGREEEAGPHLDRAERLFVLGGDESDLGVLRAEQARQAVALGNADDAVARARDAERLLRDDERHLGLKWHVLAAAYRLAGDLGQAETYYGRALDVLKQRRQWREAAAVAREWGQLLREQGRQEDALDLMEQATVLGIRDYGRSLRERQER